MQKKYFYRKFDRHLITEIKSLEGELSSLRSEGNLTAELDKRTKKVPAQSSRISGQRGFEEAEIHDSRKMSTLILRYAREHQMGKYTLVASNQLGTAESNCDLIVR